MPSVLAELAFISNPHDEKLLKKEVNQQSLATALFRGIERVYEDAWKRRRPKLRQSN